METPKDYINGMEYRLSKELARLRKHVQKPNLEYAEKYLDYLSMNDMPQTVARRCRELRRILVFLDGKDAKELKKADIEQLIKRINSMKRLDKQGEITDEGTADITKNKIRLTFKDFYRWLRGGNKRTPYPEEVAWIEVKTVSKKKLPEDMLSEAEIIKLIESCNNQRDKAMVSLLYDAGLRAGEFLRLKIKSVVLSEEMSYVIVDYRGKTGSRRVPIVFSVPFLISYINTYRKNADPEEPLFVILNNNIPTDRPMNYEAFRMFIRKLNERSGIKKHIYSHLFRFSRATCMAKTLTEQQLKMYFGWTGDSRMASVYVHMSGRDLDEAVLRANGISSNKEPERPLLAVKRCMRCHFDNETTVEYCKKCSLPLDIKRQIEDLENAKQMKERIQKLEDAIGLLYQHLPDKTKKEIENIKS